MSKKGMVQVQKTIIDVLLSKNRLTQSEAARFDANLSNREIEKILRAEDLVSADDIAKAYAVIYDLPYIRLENYDIQPSALNIIDKPTAEKYQIVAFEKDSNRIKIALGSPAEFKTTPPEAINILKSQKGLTVDLYVTTPEDIRKILGRYETLGAQEPVSKVEEAPLPPQDDLNNLKSVDLKIIKIPYEVISKFPLEICQKYNMVVFDSPNQNMIKVAISDPTNLKIKEILKFVEEKNKVVVEKYVAPPQDISEALNLYYIKPVEPPTETILGVKNPFAKPEPAVVTESAPAPIASAPPKAKPRFVLRPAEAQVKPSAGIFPKVNPQQMEAIARATPAENDLDVFLGQEVKSLDALTQIARSGNVPQILAGTIALGVAKKASDIHIEPEDNVLRIRFRIDGILRDILKMPISMQAAIVSRVKILSRLKIDEQRIPQDGRFDVKTQSHEIDLRVSTLPTVRGEKIALRILDKSQAIYSFEQLGFSGTNLKVLEENIIKPFGVILATGPTGSGKTTTLYSILKKISSPRVNVITLEDPVEYEIPGINQCQVKPKIGFSFAEGLRSVLRQDPNIIMVGEIRDAETAGLATHAALTGHLVLTTLHTNDAASALPRLINMGIEPFLITSSINLIIAQRLVRKLCEKCRKPVQIPEGLAQEIDQELGALNLPKPYQFYENSGCSECDQGFSGRIGIYEILTMNDQIEDLAIKGQPSSVIKKAAIGSGMITMKQDGLIKATQGLTTISEILRVTTSG